MAKQSNVLILSLGILLLTMSWYYYCTRLVWASLIFGAAISLISALILNKLFSIKGKAAVNKEKKHACELLDEFLIMNDATQVFSAVYALNGYAVQLKNNCFYATKPVKKLCFVNFEFDCLSGQRIVDFIKKAKREKFDKITIYCNKVCANFKEIVKMDVVEVQILTLPDCYDFLKRYDALPALAEKVKMRKANKFFALALNKNRFVYYFWSAVSLFLLSFVSFFKIYTLVFATILFAVALYSKFNNKFNEDSKTQLAI